MIVRVYPLKRILSVTLCIHAHTPLNKGFFFCLFHMSSSLYVWEAVVSDYSLYYFFFVRRVFKMDFVMQMLMLQNSLDHLIPLHLYALDFHLQIKKC